MIRPRVKICGLTRLEDAERAVELGAHAVGFIFWPRSPRVVDADRARVIARALPPFVTRVGVFVNATPADVARIADAVGLDAVQLHGDEALSAFDVTGRRIVRALSLTTRDDLDRALALPAAVLPLADTSDPVRRGGTGRTADWDLAAALARQRRMALAGGLTPANVVEAVRHVRPWAVDVASGVESAPGIKDPDKLREFLTGVLALSWEDA
jgi:phosphoribosylanthranilate isomerase